MYANPLHSKPITKNECVYLIFGITFPECKYTLAYIGRTKNLKNRINGHHALNYVLKNFDHYKLMYKETKNSHQLERVLITKYKPMLNINLVN